MRSHHLKPAASTFDASRINPACSACKLRDACMPVGLNDQEFDRVDEVVATRRTVKRGAPLFRQGDPFDALFAIRTGFFKTCVSARNGGDQVTGFRMAGDIIGLDAIVDDRHTSDAIALEDAQVCVLPFDRVTLLAREVNAFGRHVHRMLSREIVREHDMMLLLGSMRAEERLATFLLHLVRRLHARGLSRQELVLRMTREEIGSYLGLKLETVSRTFTRFVALGLLDVRQRHVRILDAPGLQAIVTSFPSSRAV